MINYYYGYNFNNLIECQLLQAVQKIGNFAFVNYNCAFAYYATLSLKYIL